MNGLGKKSKQIVTSMRIKGLETAANFCAIRVLPDVIRMCVYVRPFIIIIIIIALQYRDRSEITK